MNEHWQLKRNDNDETIELPQDMRWLDEFNYSKLAQSPPVRTLSGSVIVQQGIKVAGRPITLGGEWVWLERGDFETLQAWAEVPELKLTLTHYDGRVFTVIFRNHETPINCQPVIYLTPETDDAPYTGAINLMTVQ
ncbi:MAG: hypothetical protein CR974_03920 [Gammaproteobacteria bacterium]|nr:MAG: hypothetical protein CR974_03920 [Gammaproteobacteria bacterium]